MRVFLRFMGAAGVVGMWLAAGAVLAGEPLQINQWRVCAVADGDFQFEDPDVLAERERQKKLQQPYLHEVGDTEDPYVARHW